MVLAKSRAEARLRALSREIAKAARPTAGQQNRRRSAIVACAETQFPATDQPLRRPRLMRRPPSLTPAPSVRSTVISSESGVKESTANQSAKNSPEERSAERSTAPAPGPSPIFAPANEQEIPDNAPTIAHADAPFPLSRTSSLALMPRSGNSRVPPPTQAAPTRR